VVVLGTDVGVLGMLPVGIFVGVLGILLPVGTLIELVLFLMLLGTESLGLPVELGIASLAGVVASTAVGFFLLLVAGFFLLLVAGVLVVSFAPGVVVLGVVVLGVVVLPGVVVLGIASLAGVVVAGVVVASTALGFFSMLLAGFFLLPAVVLVVFFLVVWGVFCATVET
jgi:hypothetical protein